MTKRLKTASLVLVGFIVFLFVLSSVGGGMTKLNHEINVVASAERTFSVLADLEAVQHYNPNVITAEYISEKQQGVGAARLCDLGKDGKVKERVTDFKENKSITMELYEHNWPLKYMRWTTNVQPTAQGSVISQKLEYEMKFGLLGSLLNSMMMENKIDQTMNTVFQSMKEYIETH